MSDARPTLAEALGIDWFADYVQRDDVVEAVAKAIIRTIYNPEGYGADWTGEARAALAALVETMRGGSDGLTAEERGDLRPWDNLAYSCACLSEFCEEVPCHNDRDDLYITVERIIAARVQAAKAEAWDEGVREGKVVGTWGLPALSNPYRETGGA